jgi:CCR4-NOT transcription complex subunit 1
MIALFRFFKETIDNEVLTTDYMKLYYRGTLRVLLILLHDFQDFLSDFSFSFCEEIPEKFTQVRNMVLSAFPKNIRPPDPFAITVKFDQTDEFKIMPNIISNFEEKIKNKNLYVSFSFHLISLKGFLLLTL